jgi:hypothetical protein
MGQTGSVFHHESVLDVFQHDEFSSRDLKVLGKEFGAIDGSITKQEASRLLDMAAPFMDQKSLNDGRGYIYNRNVVLLHELARRIKRPKTAEEKSVEKRLLSLDEFQRRSYTSSILDRIGTGTAQVSFLFGSCWLFFDTLFFFFFSRLRA